MKNTISEEKLSLFCRCTFPCCLNLVHDRSPHLCHSVPSSPFSSPSGNCLHNDKNSIQCFPGTVSQTHSKVSFTIQTCFGTGTYSLEQLPSNCQTLNFYHYFYILIQSFLKIHLLKRRRKSLRHYALF